MGHGRDAATMPDQRDLFPEPKRARKKTGTPAPDRLTPPQRRALEEWAERAVPWLSREALESFEYLGSYVEEILEWWRGEGGLKVDWLATIQNRIRKAERRRLIELAKRGSESAKLALLNPEGWARGYDERAKASSAAAKAFGPEYLEPGGADVIELGTQRRRPRR